MQKMIIVLDTSAVMPDFYFQAPTLRSLLNECHRISGCVAIPEVVQAELLQNYRKRLDKICDELDKFRGCFLGHRRGVMTDEKMLELYGEYESWIKRHLRLKTIQLNVPNINHLDVIAHMSSSKRPFQEGDKGYKDFLIWRSMTDWLQANQGYACFVSENKKDFSDSSGGLHADFLADLDDLEINRSRVHYYESPKDCYEKELAPFLDKLDNIAADLKRGQYDKFDPEKWVYANWDTLLAEVTPSAEDFGPNFEFVKSVIKSLRRVKLTDVFQVTRIDDHRFTIDFSVMTTLDIELSRSPLIDGKQAGWIHLEQRSQNFDVNFILSFDEKELQVIDFEIADLSQHITLP